MNKNKSSKLNSLLAVDALLTANHDLIAGVPALVEAAGTLDGLITDIQSNVKVQTSPSGAAEAKAEALTSLGDTAFEVAGAVLSLAEKNGDRTLAARVKFPRSGITAGSSNAVVARCQDIVEAAADNMDSLGDHGVTQAKVNALKQRLKSYDGLRGLPRQAQAAGAAATRQLERLFPEAERLLQNRIDKLVWQFRVSAPEFYDKYQVARAVVDAATASHVNAAGATPEVKAA